MRHWLLTTLLLSTLMPCSSADADEPPQILLWPEGAPGAKGSEDKDKPCIWLHQPPADKRSGGAVIVCPGGGYQHLAMTYEGHEVAEWFNEYGVTGFVLRYRLGPGYHHPTQISDAQRAIRLVRSRTRSGASIRRESASWAFPPEGTWRRPPRRISTMARPMPQTRSTA